MGDWWQQVSFPEIEADAAPAAKTRVLEALWAADVVARTPTDCVLGAEVGYAPSERALAGFAPHEAERLRTLWTNGLNVATGMCFSGSELNGGVTMTCPACGASVVDEAAYALIGPAASAWIDTGAIGAVACPSCGAQSDARRWASEPPLSFTYLMATFWNWPALVDAETGARHACLPLMERAAGASARWTGGKL